MASLPEHLGQLRQTLLDAPPDAPLVTALDGNDAGAVLRALSGDLDGPAAEVWRLLTGLAGEAVGDAWQLNLPSGVEIGPGAMPVIPVLAPDAVLRLAVAGGRWDAPGGAGALSMRALELEVDLGKTRIALRAAGLLLEARDPTGILKTLGFGALGIGGDLGAIVDASGFRFTGGSQHGVELAASSPLPLTDPRFGLGWDPDRSQLALTASFSGKALGMTAVVDKVGVSFSLPGGTPTLRAKAPDGIGLSLDASSGVSGGGFLGVRGDSFGGMLHLDVGPVEVTAFGLLNPDPFSLIIVMAAEFNPGIQLSFGFMLSGVGGVIGINHRVDQAALSQMVQQGTVDQLLFPHDPVASAPAILSTLANVFPREQGSAVFGPLFRLTWGPVIPLITADLGVIVQLPDLQFVVIGRVRIALPAPDLAIVDLRAAITGHLDPALGLVEINVSLANSRVTGYPISGGLVIRVQTSGDGEMIFSAGGFHPRYTPPANLPVPQRLEIKLADSALLQITFRGYFALTSGSVQAGARLDLVAGTDDLGLTGTLGFDVLLQWSPSFGFSAHVYASLGFNFLGETVCSVSLDVVLEGPSPCWHIAGRATIKIFFAKVSFGVDESWGRQDERALPAPDVVGAVRRALERPEAWAPLMPTGAAGILRLRVPAAGEELTARVHPLGSLSVRQEVAPLNTPITRFGAAPLPAPTTLEVVAVNVAANLLAPAKRDRFAAGQFFTRSEDEQLTMPAFEEFDSGVTVQSAGTTVSPSARTVSMMYEDKTIRGGDEDGAARFRLFEEHWMDHALAHGAVGRSDVHAERTRFIATNERTVDPVTAAARAAAQRPVAVDTRTGLARSLPGVAGASTHAEAAHALAVAVAADPQLRGTVAIAAAWELA